MTLHCAQTDAELGGDGFVRAALRDEAEHIVLAQREIERARTAARTGRGAIHESRARVRMREVIAAHTDVAG